MNLNDVQNKDLVSEIKLLVSLLSEFDLNERVAAINDIREAIHSVSPFKAEPVDFVKWVPSESVTANDYNPNSVAPPEMELLRVSILADGYTQPIVAHADESSLVVVDGFHRNRVGKECKDVRARILGYLPIVQIKEEKADRSNRMASTIRHNRARGKHRVESMSDIVVELKRRNWTNERICRELGMDEDEVLRLCQITGLAELFSDQQFSKSWDVEGEVSEEDFKELTDDVSTYGEEVNEFRSVNTSDENRVFHTYDKWECHKAGFYEGSKPGVSKEQGEEMYREFLSNIPRFSAALERVISEWKHSCEHYLTNAAMNRIAWLGQAAMCYETGLPNSYRSGFFLLTDEQQKAADECALVYLNKWLAYTGRAEVTMEQAYSGERQSDIY